MLRDFSSGVSSVHDGFDRLVRTLPENVLPPRLVTMLTTPPREAAVLGGDARGQHLRLLDGVLDEDVVRCAEQVVVDVDAVDQEDVVVGEAAGDGHLSDVRRVVGEARSKLRDTGWCAAYGDRVQHRFSAKLPSGSDRRLLFFDDGRPCEVEPRPHRCPAATRNM